MTNSTPFGASAPFGSEPSFGSTPRFGTPHEGSFITSAMPCTGGDCTEAVQNLYPFLDGELALEDRSSIQAHLDACPACVSAFGFEMHLRHTVRTKLQVALPESSAQHLANRIRMAIASEHKVPPNSGN